MSAFEIGLHWAAVAIYAISSALFVASFVWQKERWMKWAVGVAGFGFALHTGALALRWAVSGHGPYMHRYEVFSSNVWVATLMFLLVQWRLPKLRPAGALVMPTSLLLIGFAVMASPEIRPLPETFKTFWLIVHIYFAKLSYGSCLLGTAFSVLLLFKNRGIFPKFTAKFPDSDILDEYSYKFIAFGFFMIGIMIAAGAIWANNAWGSYWDWDPVEIWSLVSWMLYGLYLHLRRMHRWQGERAAWFAILSLLILIFAIMGVGLFYTSLHSPYLS
jgi:cytochrome c-type biogenesis protein CcsB